MNLIHPRKLLLSKWTAVEPVAKQKHFLVTKVMLPDLPEGRIEWIEIEAVYTNATARLHWRGLRNEALWRQGWK